MSSETTTPDGYRPDAPPLGDRRGVGVLLSEGSSTSAREAVTALGLRGYAVEICDPDPHCLSRFSRFVTGFHRCPGLGADPRGFLDFMLDLVRTGRFDVLLPIHEQGFLFARVRDLLAPHVAVALPSFDSYERAHSKAGFSRLLDELAIAQPRTRFVATEDELRAIERFPAVVKMPIGTASRGTWIVRDADELAAAMRELREAGGFSGEILVQDVVEGALEHAQAVFAHGRLLAMHAFRQIARGAGGGPARKESVARTTVRAHLARIGERLHWHGALSVDYMLLSDGTPAYFDCNPRLVEPMSARLAGLDLADLLVQVSLGASPAAVPESRPGVRTHIALQALLGSALRSGARRELLRECWRLAARRSPYAESLEELTPVRLDWPSVFPVIFLALLLLARPGVGRTLPKKGWGAHLLTPESARVIGAMRQSVSSPRASASGAYQDS